METKTKPVHGTSRPWNLPDDAQDVPPVPCGLSVGQDVIYTNDYGVKFRRKVRGFKAVPWVNGGLSHFVYIFTDAWWMPVAPEQLTVA